MPGRGRLRSGRAPDRRVEGADDRWGDEGARGGPRSAVRGLREAPGGTRGRDRVSVAVFEAEGTRREPVAPVQSESLGGVSRAVLVAERAASTGVRASTQVSASGSAAATVAD